MKYESDELTPPQGGSSTAPPKKTKQEFFDDYCLPGNLDEHFGPLKQPTFHFKPDAALAYAQLAPLVVMAWAEAFEQGHAGTSAYLKQAHDLIMAFSKKDSTLIRNDLQRILD